MASFYPRYLDKVVTIRGSAVTGKPLTAPSPEVFNWLSDKLVSTQKEMLYDYANLGDTFGVAAEDRDIKTMTKELLRTEVGNASFFQEDADQVGLDPNYYITKTILFAHTTNGGAAANQRFLPNIEPWLEVRNVSVKHNASAAITDPINDYTWVLGYYKNSVNPVILYDASGYPYGFTIRLYTGASEDYVSFYVRYIAMQGFHHHQR